MYIIHFKNVDLVISGEYTEGQVGDYDNPSYNHYFTTTQVKVLGADYNIIDLLSDDDLSKIDDNIIENYYE